MPKIACTHCDLLVDTVSLKSNEHAVCPRCAQTLYVSQHSMNANSALLLAALFLFFPAILLPFIRLEVSGKEQIVSLLESIISISQGHMILLAITVFLLVIALPLIKIFGLLSITLPLSKGRIPYFGVSYCKIILNLLPWSMIEVYLIGALVTAIKLMSIADISFLIGFWLFIVVIILNAIIGIIVTKQQIWQQITTLSKS